MDCLRSVLQTWRTPVLVLSAACRSCWIPMVNGVVPGMFRIANALWAYIVCGIHRHVSLAQRQIFALHTGVMCNVWMMCDAWN